MYVNKMFFLPFLDSNRYFRLAYFRLPAITHSKTDFLTNASALGPTLLRDG